MGLFGRDKTQMTDADSSLPGRAEEMPVPATHFVNDHPIQPPFPEGLEVAIFGLGCFWGAERIFWQADGVYSTAVGYAAGSRRIPRTKKCAAAAPVTPKRCTWCSTPR